MLVSTLGTRPEGLNTLPPQLAAQWTASKPAVLSLTVVRLFQVILVTTCLSMLKAVKDDEAEGLPPPGS